MTSGLGFTRFMMVLSSFTPLFVLWWAKGTNAINDCLLTQICLSLIIIPNFILWLRVYLAKKNNDKRTIIVAEASDHSDHLLVYLFAMLIPLYQSDMSSTRELFALVLAFGFIIFIFWHMKLHYMNLSFAVFGYKVFTVFAATGTANDLNHPVLFVVLSKKPFLSKDLHINAYRLSDNVLIEKDNS